MYQVRCSLPNLGTIPPLHPQFQDVRRRRSKAVVFCETDDALQHLRRRLLCLRHPCIHLEEGRAGKKAARLRQLARFAASHAGAGPSCLLASAQCSPAGLSALGTATDLDTVVFYDSPASLSQVRLHCTTGGKSENFPLKLSTRHLGKSYSPCLLNRCATFILRQGFVSRWRPRLLSRQSGSDLEVLSLVCEGTVEDKISDRRLQERLLSDLSSPVLSLSSEEASAAPVRLHRRTVEDLLGFERRVEEGNNGCEKEVKRYCHKCYLVTTIVS